MNEYYAIVIIRLFASLVAGSLIGLERTLHGRPAGLRTHSVVALSTAMLMLLPSYYEMQFLKDVNANLRLDPTRMAQGIMTGIGFLGAGVIIKDAFSIRGLTTAASIWLSSALGIMLGAGLYVPAFATMGLSIGALAFFRFLEIRLPSMRYAKLSITVKKKNLSEDRFPEILKKHNLRFSRAGYRKAAGRGYVHYEITIHSRNERVFQNLYRELVTLKEIEEVELIPMGD